jgi:RNA polymerase sigma-70 factor (ECF subfamily)
MVRGLDIDEDAALMVAFVKSRDRKMFERLFEKYRRSMVAHASRYVKNRARAEELAQEIFVRVYTTKAYEANAKFKTWLYRVATNVCLNELRRPEHREALEGVEMPRAINPEELAVGDQLAKRLDRAIDALPANQRAAFLMARQDNLSHEEIAHALETSVSAVKSLIHRALEALRKETNQVMEGAR